MTTVSLEELFFTLIIDEHEGRTVTTFDIIGAYINVETPNYERILMNLRGDIFDIICHVNPEYN